MPRLKCKWLTPIDGGENFLGWSLIDLSAALGDDWTLTELIPSINMFSDCKSFLDRNSISDVFFCSFLFAFLTLSILTYFYLNLRNFHQLGVQSFCFFFRCAPPAVLPLASHFYFNPSLFVWNEKYKIEVIVKCKERVAAAVLMAIHTSFEACEPLFVKVITTNGEKICLHSFIH